MRADQSSTLSTIDRYGRHDFIHAHPDRIEMSSLQSYGQYILFTRLRIGSWFAYRPHQHNTAGVHCFIHSGRQQQDKYDSHLYQSYPPCRLHPIMDRSTLDLYRYHTHAHTQQYNHCTSDRYGRQLSVR